MLSATDIALIRHQTAAIAPLGYAFGAECLARAFWANPWLRAHLPWDVHALRGEITPAMEQVAATIECPEYLGACLAALLDCAGGSRLPPQALPVLAEALIATLRSRLEEAFTAEAEAAWRRVLAALEPHLSSADRMPRAA